MAGPARRVALVHRVAARHPGDAAAVAALFDSGAMAPGEVVAILGKTEGNGCVNDFTRAYAVEALSQMLATRLGATPAEVQARIALVMSGGTEGGLSPHFLVLGLREAAAATDAAGPALAIGTAFTADLPPEALGRPAQARATAAAVRAAMDQAGIASPGDVHYVQVKCPLLTSARIAAAKARGATVATEDTYHSMGLSRGASALGVALALGEVAEAALTEAAIGADWSLHSGHASCSAGIELLRNEVVVLGNSPAWGGDLVIARDVMQDAIDLPAVQRALRAAGSIPRAASLPRPRRRGWSPCWPRPSPPRPGTSAASGTSCSTTVISTPRGMRAPWSAASSPRRWGAPISSSPAGRSTRGRTGVARWP